MLKKWTVLLSTVLATASPVIAQGNDVKLPDGEGKAVVQKMCTGCHNLKTVTSKHATREQWNTIVQQMVSRGADGTDEEIETVINYLAKNFPPQKDEKQESAPAPAPRSSLITPHIKLNALSSASLLTMSKDDEAAMMQYFRSQSGS
jgi:mono/diheme cytochrome c family protein